jgi:hypothetical protein
LFLGPLIQANASIAKNEQVQSLNNAIFLSNQAMIHIGNIVQLTLLFFVICISVLKPWKKGEITKTDKV